MKYDKESTGTGKNFSKKENEHKYSFHKQIKYTYKNDICILRR